MQRLPNSKQELAKLMIEENVSSFEDFVRYWYTDTNSNDWAAWNKWYIRNWDWLSRDFGCQARMIDFKIGIYYNNEEVHNITRHEDEYTTILKLMETSDE